MKFFNGILGVFAILGSVYCLCFPGMTFLSSGWIVAILLGMWGICAIFDYANVKKNGGVASMKITFLGGISLMIGIGAAVVSIIAMFSVQMRALIDYIIIGGFVSWLIFSGFQDVVTAIKTKQRLWGLTLTLGIIICLAGIYGIFHLVYSARMLGTLIGILLMVYGVRLLLSVFEQAE